MSRSEAINDVRPPLSPLGPFLVSPRLTLVPPRAQFFELLIFSFIPILIDLPVAFVVLSVRYGFTVVSVVTLVGVI